jgi:hypothetical protein
MLPIGANYIFVFPIWFVKKRCEFLSNFDVHLQKKSEKNSSGPIKLFLLFQLTAN